jgi:hypothetical protein
VIEQAQKALGAWNQIDSTLAFGASVTEFSSAVKAANAIAAQIESIETQLTNLRNERDQKMADLWDKVKRVRFGVKAHFGDDSSQYEMVGGTRASERKLPTRKAKAA